MARAEQQEGKVVVDVTLTSEYSEDLGRWVGRVNGMGITASRREEDEAVRAATSLFAEEIQLHRELGNLALWLDRFDVNWDWDHRYVRRDDREYRDVSIPRHCLPLLSEPEGSQADQSPRREEQAVPSSPQSEFALAA